jgi:hypothetical protein
LFDSLADTGRSSIDTSRPGFDASPGSQHPLFARRPEKRCVDHCGQIGRRIKKKKKKERKKSRHSGCGEWVGRPVCCCHWLPGSALRDNAGVGWRQWRAIRRWEPCGGVQDGRGKLARCELRGREVARGGGGRAKR